MSSNHVFKNLFAAFNQTSRQRTEDIASENVTTRTGVQERLECNDHDVEVSLDGDSNHVGDIRPGKMETTNPGQPRKTLRGMQPVLF